MNKIVCTDDWIKVLVNEMWDYSLKSRDEVPKDLTTEIELLDFTKDTAELYLESARHTRTTGNYVKELATQDVLKYLEVL